MAPMRSPRRSIGHEDRLTVVGHLDELRTRMIVCLLVVAVAFGFCFWQNHRLLQLVNAPLAHQTQQQVREGHGPLGATYALTQSTRDLGVQLRSVVDVLQAGHARPAAAAVLSRAHASLARDISRLSAPPQGDRPVTLAIGEPFTSTVTVSLIFALTLALPVLLGQAYGFLGPALDPRQRRRMRPLLAAIPGLFVAGLAFGYYIVLPAAVHFLQNFNSSQFSVLVQASQYYKFAATTLLAMGLLFQVPAAILVVTRAGVISARQLRRKRRYALAACAALAAFLPGDATTMLLEAVPVYLLFEISVAVAALAERRARAAAAPQTA
jgi:sec-independent protein translocase protein TatC